MRYLAPVDWMIIVAYLAGIIAFGVWSGRGQKSARDYFLGSRNIPWWGVALSIVATETSALTFLGIPALAYGGDLTFLQIVIGYILARIILAVVLVPHYFRGDIYSPYALLEKSFGEPARRTAGMLFLISGTLAAGVRVYVTCIPIQLMFGLSENGIILAILLFVGLSLIYTFVGGIKAVVWTDAVQFLLLLAGGIFAAYHLTHLVEGGAPALWETAREAGKLQWLNLRFSAAMPYNLWMGLIGATFMAMSTHGADQLVVQRILACQDVRAGRRALILSAVIILPLFALFLMVGIGLWVLYQQSPLPIAIPEVRPGVSKNDYVFPIFILTQTPLAIKGLMVVAILSAAMSSVSSALSALASVTTMDFCKRLLGSRAEDEKWLLRFSRQTTIFWALVLVAVAWLSQQVASVLTLAFSLNGLTNGAMLGGLLLALVYKKQARPGPIVTGMLVSLVGMLIIHFGARSEFWISREGIQIAWPWYTLIGMVITLGMHQLMSRFVNREPRLEYPEPIRDLTKKARNRQFKSRKHSSQKSPKRNM